LAVRRPLIEAARQQARLTGEAVVQHWCASETLRSIAAFAERAIKRRV